MLHYDTISPSTLELLILLQSSTVFSSLRLVGGTSLALQIGHRNSLDLDLFGELKVDEITMFNQLKSIGSAVILKKTQHIQVYLLNGIKVDFVDYPYPWIEDALLLDRLTLAGKKDIAAMKLAAITGGGSKKDFIDIFYLLQEFSLKQMLDFYTLKYHDGNSFLVLKSLSYFTDADSEPDPLMMDTLDWNDIKQKLINVLKNYLLNEN
jgi:hypothetical protein